jgi:signal transduction histidine kinase
VARPIVLIVDDSRVSLQLMQSAVASLGVDVVTARSGEEALAALKLHTYALALLDVHMHDMTGIQVAERMHNDPATRDIPRIMVTGESNPDHIMEAYEYGAVDYVLKPVNITVLRAKVRVFAELFEKRRAVEALNAEQHRLLDFAAHDLRSPLTVIKLRAGLLRAMAADRLRDNEMKLLDSVNRSVEFMSELLDDLLGVAGFQGGRVQVQHAPADLAEVVRRVLDDHRVTAEQKKLLLQSEGEGPCTVPMDARLIEQALEHLVSNAIKFSRDGGQVTARWAPQGSNVRVEVIDQGVGIAPELQAEVFKPFAEGRSPGTHGEKSTGLGLCLARGIIESHGGRIWLESAPGAGTTFTFVLPRPE